MFATSTPLLQLLPALTLTVPFVGQYDFRPLVAATVMFVGLTVLFWLLRAVVLGRAKALSARSSNTVDDVIVDAVGSIKASVYSFVALYAALSFFTLPTWLSHTLDALFYFMLVWQFIVFVSCFIKYFVERFIEKDEDGDGLIDPNAATAADLITLISKIVMWTLGIIFVLSNLGIEVTSLIAGLGIGGVAIAFALQGILSDLFASFSIYFDRPFRVGDFIVIGANMGTVERIGVKSTRIRTFQGEELVVSNAELTTTRIQNFKRMRERRIATQFGITYETPQDKVQMVNGIIERIFEDMPKARLDRTHFASFGDSALVFEVVYFVESADYNEFMNLQQQFNFTLLERFAEIGIGFAYPTQTIYHKQLG
ncbi:mechanosensitive ion channel family protein [Candidatus Kaiserbacteria bacterium]|nr:mechanosensitive ion channel family protein [Candidatus Kaiserbacteria bacterium]